MPKGRYSLPACLKHVLDDFIEQIQTDKCMYQVGGKQFSFEKVENGPIKMNKDRDTDEELDDDLCSYCRLPMEKECHKTLFDDYCYAVVQRYFNLYPTAVTREEARRLYIFAYNSALHFHNFEKYEIMTEMTYMMPPNCLKFEMDNCIDFIGDQHDKWVKDMREEQYLELKQAGMDMYRNDIGEF